MRLENCPVCSYQNSSQAETCKNCNHPVGANKRELAETKSAFRKLIYVAIGAILLYIGSETGILQSALTQGAKKMFPSTANR